MLRFDLTQPYLGLAALDPPKSTLNILPLRHWTFYETLFPDERLPTGATGIQEARLPIATRFR